jgi:hypothetical protein
MSWTEAMKEIADVGSRSSVSTDANAIRSATSTSWDPYAVWLTRVTEPRDRAAGRATPNAPGHARRLPD